jgi:putative MATE family efflux protein
LGCSPARECCKAGEPSVLSQSNKLFKFGALEREIWAMAWPAMAVFLLTNAVDLVDIAIVGRLGQKAVAAVGYAAQCAQLLRTLLLAVGAGCLALVARAVGAAERDHARNMLNGSLLLSVVVALFLGGLGAIFPEQLLHALHAEDDVVALAVPYFRFSLAASLVFSVSTILDSAQRAHRNMRTPLLIAAIAAGLKIALDFLLIFGWLGAPRLGLTGAALATFIAEAAALGLFWLAGRSGEAGAVLLPEAVALAELLPNARAVLRVSLPAVGERLVMNLALLVYFAILSGYGTGAIAAYAIGVRLLAFSWIPGVAFGAASATLVGQSLGARDLAGARRGGWRSMQLALGMMGLLGVFCAFGREALGRFFTSDHAVIEQLLPFLLMLALAQPFMGAHFSLSGALRGAGDTMTPLLGAAVGNWLLRIPLAWLMASVFHEPVLWAWAALVFDHILRAIWYVLRFRGERWMTRLG